VAGIVRDWLFEANRYIATFGALEPLAATTVPVPHVRLPPHVPAAAGAAAAIPAIKAAAAATDATLSFVLFGIVLLRIVSAGHELIVTLL